MVMPDIFSAVTQSEEPQPHPILASFLLCSAHCSNTTHRQYPWVRSSFPGFLMAHTLITHHFLPTLPPTRSDEFLVISLALQTIGFFLKFHSFNVCGYAYAMVCMEVGGCHVELALSLLHADLEDQTLAVFRLGSSHLYPPSHPAGFYLGVEQ